MQMGGFLKKKKNQIILRYGFKLLPPYRCSHKCDLGASSVKITTIKAEKRNTASINYTVPTARYIKYYGNIKGHTTSSLLSVSIYTLLLLTGCKY